MNWRAFLGHGRSKGPLSLDDVRSVTVRSGHGKAQQPGWSNRCVFRWGRW